MRISVVTTLYKSARTLREFHERMSRCVRQTTDDYEIVYVNDGSPDDSADIVRGLRQGDSRVGFLDLSRNFGHHKAMLTGLRHARGEYVFLIDCDLEEAPELFAVFWNRIRSDSDLDVIYGVRDKRREAFLFRVFGSVFWKLFNRLAGTKLQSNPCTVRIMTRRFVNEMNRFTEQDFFFMGISEIVGFRQIPLIIEKGYRNDSSYSFSKRVSLAIGAISSFSSKPLEGIGVAGVGMGLVALGMFAVVLLKALLFKIPVSGWASLMTSLWIIGAAILSSLGIMGIYIAKLYTQSKLRPQVIVKDKLPSRTVSAEPSKVVPLFRGTTVHEEVKIPFNRPYLSGREVEHIVRAIINGHSAGNGPFTVKCEELLSQLLGNRRVLLTTSCTHALEMAAMLIDIRAGDEVIVPSYTFVSTANAFAMRGARPVFVDIREDTLNIDESKIEEKVTERTKAIVPVHYGGVGCEMDKILEISRRRKIYVVEDNAHGLFAERNGTMLGTFGHLAALSFHETKNIICGEGGALIVNDDSLAERAEIIREKGTNRSRFFRGQVDKYTWCDLGSSFVMSDLLAAFLYGQLENRESILQKRQIIWERYSTELAEWAESAGIQCPSNDPMIKHSYHVFYLIFPSLDARHDFMRYMKERGISCVFHYVPLHESPMGKSFGDYDCPVASSVGQRLVRLPLFPGMSSDELSYVIDTTRAYRCKGSLRMAG